MKTRLKRLREKSGLTQVEAAVSIGVAQSTVSMWETGESVPNTRLLPKIASAYSCKISDILDNEQESYEEG